MRKAVLIAIAVLRCGRDRVRPRVELVTRRRERHVRDRRGVRTGQAADLHQASTLTIATGNPAYKPWYGGESVPDSDWKAGKYTGDPHSGEGYEGAFAYALAQKLGFTNDQVAWLGIPFSKSFAPGPKDYDFAMQQISHQREARAKRSTSAPATST